MAQQAHRASQVLREEDRPYLIAAAWLHDIGYAPSIATTAFHPLDGARHVRALGQERLARLVAYHSSAWWEAEALGLSDDLAAFSRKDSATADALTYCDMTTSPTGQRITLAGRLAEIAERYGAEHLVVRCLQHAYDHLAGAVQRTELNLGHFAAGRWQLTSPEQPTDRPEELLIADKLELAPDFPINRVVETINEAERRIREAVPNARIIYMEPDSYAPTRTAEPARPADAARAHG